MEWVQSHLKCSKLNLPKHPLLQEDIDNFGLSDLKSVYFCEKNKRNSEVFRDIQIFLISRRSFENFLNLTLTLRFFVIFALWKGLVQVMDVEVDQIISPRGKENVQKNNSSAMQYFTEFKIRHLRKSEEKYISKAVLTAEKCIDLPLNSID